MTSYEVCRTMQHYFLTEQPTVDLRVAALAAERRYVATACPGDDYLGKQVRSE